MWLPRTQENIKSSTHVIILLACAISIMVRTEYHRSSKQGGGCSVLFYFCRGELEKKDFKRNDSIHLDLEERVNFLQIVGQRNIPDEL